MCFAEILHMLFFSDENEEWGWRAICYFHLPYLLYQFELVIIYLNKAFYNNYNTQEIK